MAAGSNIGVPVSLGSPRFDTIASGPFLVTNAHFPAGHTLCKHFHDRTVLGVTLAGEWDSIVGRTRLANAPGMLHVEPAGDCHVNHFGGQDTRVMIIQPDQSDTALLGPFKALLVTAFQIRVGFLGLQIAERLQRELWGQDDLTPLALESLCLDLLVSASRSRRAYNEPAPAWLLRTVDYAHARFLDRPSLRDLANVAGVSAEHFNRQFRRLYRMGAAQYIRRLRLEWAAERLRKADESLAEIASAAGFADQSHFTRRFKRQFGTTPAAFRAVSGTATKPIRGPW
jgi:AraC family transcriptional regulator